MLRARPFDPARTTCLYFVQEQQGGHIKIGVSLDPRARIRTMQVHNPVDLKVLGLFVVNQTTEREAHWMFRDHRVRGEWFTPHEDILAYIETLRAFGFEAAL